uniref:RING-type domain-containing protein n=1 Tax=Meloidogyne floridensis TaxID=298350 RepID=A0A915P746_9BILA
MADKIYKIHKRAKEYDLFTIQPAPENMNNDKNAILDKYKIPFENKFYVLKLKSESLDDDLLKQNYDELSECVLFIITLIGYNKSYLTLIDEKQIYFKKFPDKVSTVTDIKINEEFKVKNKDKECFCLDNLINPENEENQEIQQITECKHNFHRNCLQGW